MNQFKIKVSPFIEKLVEGVAELSGKSRTATLEHLLYQVELHARNGLLPKTFGFDVIEVATTLINQGHGAKHLDPVHLAGGERIDFDVSLLEKSAKSKTGFAGVNATTGGSFRALVPDVEQGGGSRYLASRPTAVRAAIDRYEHFKKHNIPYGNLGWHVNELKLKYPDWTDEQCLERLLLVVGNGDVQGLKNPITRREVEHALERYRKPEIVEHPGFALSAVDDDEIPEIPEPPPLPPLPARKPLVSVPDVVHCAVCKQEIDEGEPFGPHGKTDYAHVSCLA